MPLQPEFTSANPLVSRGEKRVLENLIPDLRYHIRACGIEKIDLIGDQSIYETLLKLLVEEQFELNRFFRSLSSLPTEGLTGNLLITKPVPAHSLKEWLVANKNIFDRCSITLPLLLERELDPSYDEEADWLISELNLCYRSSSQPALGKPFWITFTRKQPTLIQVNGKSLSGKSTISRLLTANLHSPKRIHGDFILHQIATGKIEVGSLLKAICFEGFKGNNWSISIGKINSDEPLSIEFSELLVGLADGEDVIFEMWSPIALDKTIRETFRSKGYRTWRLNKIDAE